jgi:hypothetical protein
MKDDDIVKKLTGVLFSRASLLPPKTKKKSSHDGILGYF